MQQKNFEMTPKSYMKTLSTIHLALVAGIIAFSMVIYFQGEDWNVNLSETENTFFFLVPILSVCGIVFGNILFKSNLKKLLNKEGLKDKLAGYQTASIINFAFIEGPALLGIISAMQSGNMLYLIIAGILVIYMFSLKPTKDKIEKQLELNSKLKSQFSNSNKLVQ